MTNQVVFSAAHSSGQFSDTETQQRSDAHRLCRRMKERKWEWLTGTEGGSLSVLPPAFRGIDQEFGLRFRKGKTGDVWLMHRLDLFSGEVEQEWYKVLDGVAGQFADRGVFRVTGHCPMLDSDLTILVSHFLTDGDPSSSVHPHLEGNRKIAHKIGELGKLYGAHRDLVFYGGDQNIQDRRTDTFLGAPFTSLADELKRWQNTGHGAIDVMASYNADHRVQGVTWMVFDDSEFRLSSDHWLCEGSWAVRV